MMSNAPSHVLAQAAVVAAYKWLDHYVYLGFLNDAVWSLSVICCKSDDKITRETYTDVNVQSHLNSFNSVTVACGKI